MLVKQVRLQSQPLDQPLKFNGPWDCMLQTFKKEGLKGLWRVSAGIAEVAHLDSELTLVSLQGVSMPVCGAMAENATLFVVYNQSLAFLTRAYPPPAQISTNDAPHLNPVHLGLSAALAGACASFVLTPVELVKCKMQVQGSLTPPPLGTGASGSQGGVPRSLTPGPLQITRTILQTEGLRGLWLGQTGTLIRETGGSAAWFGTFEFCSRAFIKRRVDLGQTRDDGSRINKGDLSAVELMASGAAAGVIYNCVLYPADCIKSTIQTEDELRGSGVGQRQTFMQVGKDIYRARGIKGLYQGCGLTALRAAPSSALIFYM